MEEQVVAIWSATNGHLDKIPVSEVQRFLQDLLTQLRGTTTVLDDIKTSGELSDATVETLTTSVTAFKDSFYVEDQTAA